MFTTEFLRGCNIRYQIQSIYENCRTDESVNCYPAPRQREENKIDCYGSFITIGFLLNLGQKIISTSDADKDINSQMQFAARIRENSVLI